MSLPAGRAVPAQRTVLLAIFGFLLCCLVIINTAPVARTASFVEAIKKRNGVESEQATFEVPSAASSHVDMEEVGVPLTEHVAGLHGYQVFDNLYIHDGNYLAVLPKGMSRRSSRIMPSESEVLSGGDIGFKLIESDEAELEFGKSVIGRLPGVTVIFNDKPGVAGYMVYHTNFVSECFAGAFKALGAAPPRPTLDSLPARIMFPKCNDFEGWSDDRGLTPTLLTTLFPGTHIEEEGGWRARVKSGMPVVLDRVVIVDRPAAHTGKGDVEKWGKMFSNVAKLETPEDFFEPVRKAMIKGLGIKDKPTSKPVVTYLDHQSEGRRLLKEDHEELLKALKTLTDVAEVHVAKPKQMTAKEKIELISKTSVLLTVHNDDLLQQMWMKASDVSTVMEIFDVGGYSPDWALLSKMMGHRYLPIHNDAIFTEPKRRIETPGFHGSGIRVDGEFIAEIIRDILVHRPSKDEDEDDS